MLPAPPLLCGNRSDNGVKKVTQGSRSAIRYRSSVHREGVRNPVGTHVQVGKGLVKGALARAEEIGAEVIQVFVGNPRGWAPASGDPAVDRAFRDACTAANRRVF